MAAGWFSNPFNFFSQNQDQTPSYRGVETRRQSSVNGRSRPPFNPTASIVIDRGLINKPGENNCFLNAAVQILWHTDVFRRSFRKFEGHTCDGETCIFCALKVLFTQYQYSGQVALPPDVLRVAMSECYENQHKFQLGIMDDAAECFEKILEQIHFNLTGSSDLDVCSTPWCVSHQKFALTTVEQTVCQCRANSEPLTFVEFVHYVTTSQIVGQSEKFKKEGHQNVFDQCLYFAGATGANLRCQNYPKCQRDVYFRRTLLNTPDVICIGFIWDSASPPLSYIMSVVESIDTKIHLKKLFDQVVSDKIRDVEFQLTAMITYYGRHYSTFCFHSHKKEWIYFDDARFRKAGKDWNSVVGECRKAHFQPLLLVYTNPNGVPVDTSEAPTQVTLATQSSNGNSQTVVSTPTSTAVNSNSTSPSSPPSEVTVGNQQPHYMNVPSQDPHHTKLNTSPEPSGVSEDQPLYDNVRTGRTHPPAVQKQEHIADMIEFSLTPMSIAASTSKSSSNVVGRLNPVASREAINSNPFMIQDLKLKSKEGGIKPGVQHSPGVLTDDVNLRDYFRGKNDLSKDHLYKHSRIPTEPIPPTHSPQLQQATPTIKQQTTPTSDRTAINLPLTPVGRGIRSPTGISPSVHDPATNNSLQTNIRGLPKNIRDAILHAGLCLMKAKQTSDHAMIAILLESAGSHVHRVVNQSSVAACSDLQSHLKSKLEAIRKELMKLDSELNNARSDPLAIQSVLSNGELNFERPQAQQHNLQTCLECKQRRVCDESLLCGPCRLKLRIQHTN